ncbi:GNAT family N-acetyltransferase [Oceanimonas doudoroffii]|uniref:GNAT family N-acetyltransferase n=1 Tax=Oceanimonas doudoroffii TaxID=84158 RepID=A0A233RAN5_9GAMM|nr:GNAT family N-acetyltransferase [Oceanimonas doudoroffii]OXY80450.1 GNAT family N-acetyltransferase [Oceanimonas doudoroffii]
MSLRLHTVTGQDLTSWLTELAELRIRVFREFPYLYDGNLEYEQHYLSTYTRCEHSVCVLALDGDLVVGASTGLPLAREVDEFKAPFAAAGLNAERIFYCAESVLLSDYRGRGLYRAFFDGREAHAGKLGFDTAAFCAVVRPDHHPLKPAGYRPLTEIWARFGYHPAPGLVTRFGWKDRDRDEETDKPMQFYLKSLEASQ